MTSLGTLEIGLKLNRTVFDAEVRSLHQKLSSNQLSRTIRVSVDDRELTQLNKHIDLKIKHLKQLRAEAAKPIIVRTAFSSQGLSMPSGGGGSGNNKSLGELKSIDNGIKSIKAIVAESKNTLKEIAENTKGKGIVGKAISRITAPIAKTGEAILFGVAQNATKKFSKGLETALERNLSSIIGSFENLGDAAGETAYKSVSEGIEAFNTIYDAFKLISTEMAKQLAKARNVKFDEKAFSEFIDIRARLPQIKLDPKKVRESQLAGIGKRRQDTVSKRKQASAGLVEVKRLAQERLANTISKTEARQEIVNQVKANVAAIDAAIKRKIATIKLIKKTIEETRDDRSFKGFSRAATGIGLVTKAEKEGQGLLSLKRQQQQIALAGSQKVAGVVAVAKSQKAFLEAIDRQILARAKAIANPPAISNPKPLQIPVNIPRQAEMASIPVAAKPSVQAMQKEAQAQISRQARIKEIKSKFAQEATGTSIVNQDELVKKLRTAFTGAGKNLDLPSKFGSREDAEKAIAKALAYKQSILKLAEVAKKEIDAALEQLPKNKRFGSPLASVKGQVSKLAKKAEKFDAAKVMASLGLESMSKEAAQAGIQTTAGFKKGVIETLADIKVSGKEIGETALESIDESLEIRSPSREGRRRGEYLVQGIVQGAEKALYRLRNLFKKKENLLGNRLPDLEAPAINTEPLEDINTVLERIQKNSEIAATALSEIMSKAVDDINNVQDPDTAKEYVDILENLRQAQEELNKVTAEAIPISKQSLEQAAKANQNQFFLDPNLKAIKGKTTGDAGVDQILLNAEANAMKAEDALRDMADPTIFQRMGAAFNQISEQLDFSIPIIGQIKKGLFGIAAAMVAIAAANAFKELVVSGIQVYASFESINAQLRLVKDGGEYFGAIKEQVGRLGGSLKDTAEAAVQLDQAFIGGRLEKSSQQMFLDLNESLLRLQLGAESTSRALLAVTQMGAKGKVSMEEVLQLAEAGVPGVMGVLAESFGGTVEAMIAQVSSGNVMAEELLPKFVEGLKQNTDILASAVEDSITAAMGRVSFQKEQLLFTIGATVAPAAKAAIDAQQSLLELINENFDSITRAMGILTVQAVLFLTPWKALGAMIASVAMLIKGLVLSTSAWAAAMRMVSAAVKSLGVSLLVFAGIQLAIELWQKGSTQVRDANKEIEKTVLAIANAYKRVAEEKAKSEGKRNLPQKNPQGFFGGELANSYDAGGIMGFLDRLNPLAYKGVDRGLTYGENLALERQQEIGQGLQGLTQGMSFTENLFNAKEIESFIAHAKILDQQIDALEGKSRYLRILDPNANRDAIAQIEQELEKLQKQREQLGDEFLPMGAAGLENLKQQIENYKATIIDLQSQGLDVATSLAEVENLLRLINVALKKNADINDEITNGYNEQRKALIEMQSAIAKTTSQTTIDQANRRAAIYATRANEGSSPRQMELVLNRAEVQAQQQNLANLKQFQSQRRSVLGKMTADVRETMEGLAGQSIEDIDAGGLARIQAYLETAPQSQKKELEDMAAVIQEYVQANEQVAQGNESLAQSQVQLNDAIRQSAIEKEAFAKTVVDFSRTLEDFAINAERQIYEFNNSIYDYNFSVAEFNKEQFRSFRNLSESYQDLYRSIEQQTLAAENAIKETTRKINSIALKDRLSDLNPTGVSNPFQGALDTISSLSDALDQFEQGMDAQAETRLSIEQQNIEIARQIRGLYEQQADMETARLQSIRQFAIQAQQLAWQHEDFARNQKRQWEDILYQQQQIAQQAYEIGIGLDDIGKGITASGQGLIDAISNLASGVSTAYMPTSASYTPDSKSFTPTSPSFVPTGSGGSKQQALIKGASMIGMDPLWYAMIIARETGGTFDPFQRGGYGKKYRGTIQYNPENQKRYGIHAGQSFENQVTGSNVRYFRDRGFRQGMSLAQAYATVLAGSPKYVDRRDVNGSAREAAARDFAPGGHWYKVGKQFLAGAIKEVKSAPVAVNNIVPAPRLPNRSGSQLKPPTAKPYSVRDDLMSQLRGVAPIAPIAKPDFSGVEAERQRALQEQQKKERELAKKQLESAIGQANRQLIGDTFRTSGENIAIKRGLEDLNLQWQDMARNAKGYLTIQERIAKAGEDAIAPMRTLKRQLEDTVRENSRILEVGQNAQGLEDLNAQIARIRESATLGTAEKQKYIKELQKLIEAYQSGVFKEYLEGRKLELATAQAMIAEINQEYDAVKRLNEERERANALFEQQQGLFNASNEATAAEQRNRGGEGLFDRANHDRILFENSDSAIQKRLQDEAQRLNIAPNTSQYYELADSLERIQKANISGAFRESSQALQQFEDTLVGVLMGTTNLEDGFKSLFNTIAAEAIKMTLVRPIVNMLGGLLGGLLGGGGSGGLSFWSPGGGGANPLASSYSGIGPSVLSFAGGGFISSQNIAKAMVHEKALSGGGNPVLAVLNDKEYIVSGKDGQLFEEFKREQRERGMAVQYASVKNFNQGGFSVASASRGGGGGSGGGNTYIINSRNTITVPTASYVGESLDQIKHREEQTMSRASQRFK